MILTGFFVIDPLLGLVRDTAQFNYGSNSQIFQLHFGLDSRHEQSYSIRFIFSTLLRHSVSPCNTVITSTPYSTALNKIKHLWSSHCLIDFIRGKPHKSVNLLDFLTWYSNKSSPVSERKIRCCKNCNGCGHFEMREVAPIYSGCIYYINISLSVTSIPSWYRDIELYRIVQLPADWGGATPDLRDVGRCWYELITRVSLWCKVGRDQQTKY